MLFVYLKIYIYYKMIYILKYLYDIKFNCIKINPYDMKCKG